MLVAAYWSVALAWRVWRGALWREGSDRLERLEDHLAARVFARRAGWEVRGARGWVRVRGGLGGVVWTARRADGARLEGVGWPDPDGLGAWFSEPVDQPAA